VDYFVRFFGPAIILWPKDVEFPLSRLENPENANHENRVGNIHLSTGAWLRDSKVDAREKFP